MDDARSSRCRAGCGGAKQRVQFQLDGASSAEHEPRRLGGEHPFALGGKTPWPRVALATRESANPEFGSDSRDCDRLNTVWHSDARRMRSERGLPRGGPDPRRDRRDRHEDPPRPATGRGHRAPRHGPLPPGGRPRPGRRTARRVLHPAGVRRAHTTDTFARRGSAIRLNFPASPHQHHTLNDRTQR